jgi:hypothetical protein
MKFQFTTSNLKNIYKSVWHVLNVVYFYKEMQPTWCYIIFSSICMLASKKLFSKGIHDSPNSFLGHVIP